jgi:hypothetical protein
VPAATLPEPERPAVSPLALFDAWAAERRPADATVARWRAVLVALAAAYPDANKIGEEEAPAWLHGLIECERSAATVRDIWRRAASVVFGWAKDQRRLAANPFASVKITVPRAAPQTRSKSFTPEETATILGAALQATSPAKRWAPWLQAYSGARGGELTQSAGRMSGRSKDIGA